MCITQIEKEGPFFKKKKMEKLMPENLQLRHQPRSIESEGKIALRQFSNWQKLRNFQKGENIDLKSKIRFSRALSFSVFHCAHRLKKIRI